MRPIVNSTFISLDGVQNHMERWHFDYIDDEQREIVSEQIAAADAMLMGRGTYEAYASVWPDRDDAYSHRINALRKYVASTTLTAPQWQNTTVLEGDLIDNVERLKADGDGSILMHGFGPVAKSLVAAGLLDELHLWIHPVFAGIGDANDLILPVGVNVALDHVATRTLRSGVVLLSYRPNDKLGSPSRSVEV
jgi:dihydrofolate reductase